MNRDQVDGRMDQAKGKIKEGAGKALGDDDLHAEGRIDQVSGKVQTEYGDAKEDVKDKIDKI